jgi:YVTN family beta-propeller protein
MLGILASSFTALSQEHMTAMNANPGFAEEMMHSMEIMDKDMTAAPITGDPDRDFSAMMIPHHQGAIDMAKAVLLYGKDPVLKRLAQEIIVTQQQEIDVMRLRLAALNSNAPMAAAKQPATTSAPERAKESTKNSLATAEDIPVSSHDRVYTADQTSDTVSVIDPASNRLLGVIRLGDPVAGALRPLYRGQLLVHGMGFSPNHRILAVISIGSNSATLIDTASNRVLGTVYIGRSPHEGFFTPDGRELWVTVRGENYISVIDPQQMKEVRRVQTANGPGMVLFRPDGKYAFVPSSFTPELDVVDAHTYQVIARVPQASPFSPNLAVSRDGKEVWFTLKDSGKTQVMSAEAPFQVLNTLDCGPICNHVTLVDNAQGKFAYVTVGGENVVKVFRRGPTPKLIATIPTGDLPHGIWGSGDGTRVYVGLENQDAVVAIDTLENRVIATISVGQQPQALVYVPQAVPDDDGATNLVSLGDSGKAAHLRLAAPAGQSSQAKATVSVNNVGPLDVLQAAVTGLLPREKYTLWLVESRTAPYENKQALATFQANASGAQVAQAIGPLRTVLASEKTAAKADGSAAGGERAAFQRYLMVTHQGEENTAVLIQADDR